MLTASLNLYDRNMKKFKLKMINLVGMLRYFRYLQASWAELKRFGAICARYRFRVYSMYFSEKGLKSKLEKSGTTSCNLF